MGAGMWQNRGVVFACNRSSRYLDVKTRRSGWVRLFSITDPDAERAQARHNSVHAHDAHYGQR